MNEPYYQEAIQTFCPILRKFDRRFGTRSTTRLRCKSNGSADDRRSATGRVAQGHAPGWKPGIEGYPLKNYFAKLKLWYRCTECPDEIIGPLVAGRLQGRAQRIALELKLIRPDGTYDVGDAALVRLSVDEVIDPNDGTNGAASSYSFGSSSFMQCPSRCLRRHG